MASLLRFGTPILRCFQQGPGRLCIPRGNALNREFCVCTFFPNNHLKYNSNPSTNQDTGTFSSFESRRGHLHSSFLGRLTAEQLWKGVTSVSNAGKKRGRARSVKFAKNLNKGQFLGTGESNMVWPGLNAPILRGKEVIQQSQLPPDPERLNKLYKIRDEMGSKRRLKLKPHERGYSGTKFPGRSIGPPDAVGEDTFENFDTKVLELKQVATMTASLGRKRRVSAFVCAGNGNGLAGFSLAKAPEGRSAMRKAKNQAALKLMFVERFEGHTVYHDIYTRYGRTKIFIRKKPEGYGLVCHRVLKTICELVGIKNMYAKVEGSTKNIQTLTKAFFIGLIRQKTHQQIADEKKLHVVEFRAQNDYFPRVLASPERCRTQAEIPKTEVLDYEEVVNDGRKELIKPKKLPFYTKLPGWQIHLHRTIPVRNWDKVKVQTMLDYGAMESFLNIRYREQRLAAKAAKSEEKPKEAV